VAEIPAKKLKRGRGKKVGWKNLWPNFGKILAEFLPKVAEKGSKKNV
jgi:hypothetical protein